MLSSFPRQRLLDGDNFCENHWSNMNVKPFLKWVGGKRWFTQHHADLLPKKYNRYIEPFLGSGAIFFYVKPQNAILGDINNDLINTYKAIKKNWKLVFRYLKAHNKAHNKEYYYQIRDKIPSSIFTQAARFIYFFLL